MPSREKYTVCLCGEGGYDEIGRPKGHHVLQWQYQGHRARVDLQQVGQQAQIDALATQVFASTLVGVDESDQVTSRSRLWSSHIEQDGSMSETGDIMYHAELPLDHITSGIENLILHSPIDPNLSFSDQNISLTQPIIGSSSYQLSPTISFPDQNTSLTPSIIDSSSQQLSPTISFPDQNTPLTPSIIGSSSQQLSAPATASPVPQPPAQNNPNFPPAPELSAMEEKSLNRKELDRRTVQAKEVLLSIQSKIQKCSQELMSLPSYDVLQELEATISHLHCQIQKIHRSTPSLDNLKALVLEQLNQLETQVTELKITTPDHSHKPKSYSTGEIGLFFKCLY
jgi:hypothetical protein